MWSNCRMCLLYSMVFGRREKVLSQGNEGRDEGYLWKACPPGFLGTFCCFSCSLFSWHCSQCYYNGSSGSWDRFPFWSGWSPRTGMQSLACPDSPESRQKGVLPAHARISAPLRSLGKREMETVRTELLLGDLPAPSVRTPASVITTFHAAIHMLLCVILNTHCALFRTEG